MKQQPYSRFQLARKFLRYWIRAENSRGHGVHSPFVYRLIRDVLMDRGHYYAYTSIESRRAKMERDSTPIEILDLGAGKKGLRQSTIKAVTRRTSKSQKLGRLLFRLSNYFQPSTILELGTSMGISAAYLYAGHCRSQLYTLEGAPAVADRARELFNDLGYEGITTITGNFDDTLVPLLQRIGKVDMVYMDGNHRLAPTLRYFRELLPHLTEESVVIMDDIHWSEEMEAAWDEVRNHPSVRCTVDLFFIGLVFFSPSFKEKQHFSIRF